MPKTYTDKELIALKDIQAYIDFGIRNHHNYRRIINALYRDIVVLNTGNFKGLLSSGHAITAAIVAVCESGDLIGIVPLKDGDTIQADLSVNVSTENMSTENISTDNIKRKGGKD